MDKYTFGPLLALVLVASFGYIAITSTESTKVSTTITKEPPKPISITTSEADLIVVTYQPGTYSQENYRVFVFHTTQEGRKYTCFLTEERVANGVGSGISCTRDIQTVN